MKLRYLLDTNICIYISKKKPTSVLERFRQISVDEIGMSLITYSELLFGAEKSNQAECALKIIEELSLMIPPLPLPLDVGKHYAKIRTTLEKQGNIIGNNDLWIAAHAMAINAILVTNNVNEFARIKSLSIE